MAHGKFGSLSSRLLPLGPRLTLVLPWKGVQGHPPTVPRILGQHLLARLRLTSCCLTSPGQISSRPPLATWRSLSTPARIAFYFRERSLSPLKSKIAAGRRRGRHGHRRSEPSLGSTAQGCDPAEFLLHLSEPTVFRCKAERTAFPRQGIR